MDQPILQIHVHKIGTFCASLYTVSKVTPVRTQRKNHSACNLRPQRTWLYQCAGTQSKDMHGFHVHRWSVCTVYMETQCIHSVQVKAGFLVVVCS